MTQVRIVFAGTPDVAIPSLQALLDAGHDVAAVITRPDAARGRSKKLRPSPVAEFAAAQGLQVLKPVHPRESEFVDTLTTIAPQVCPVVAYGALVPKHVLEIPTYGWINLHFSLLPRWRGAAPVQHTLMTGDEVAGATVFQLVPELDAGPIFGSLIQPLDGSETAGELLDLLAVEGAELLADVVASLPTAIPVEQDDPDAVTVAPKISVADAVIDWNRDGRDLERLIRACSPNPTAWTTLNGERLRISYARPLDESTLAPGQLRPEKRRVVVGTGSIDLELVRVQPAGKRDMDAADWGRGLHPDSLQLGS